MKSKKCLKCGAENPITAQFCKICGAKIEPEVQKQENNKEKRNKDVKRTKKGGNTFLFVFVFIVVFVLLSLIKSKLEVASNKALHSEMTINESSGSIESFGNQIEEELKEEVVKNKPIDESEVKIEETLQETNNYSENNLINGTYTYDDGSVYNKAIVSEDSVGKRMDIESVGYGGHQLGVGGGYLKALGNGVYTCYDGNDYGTMTLNLTAEGFSIVTHPNEGMESMYSNFDGDYIYSGNRESTEKGSKNEFVLPNSNSRYLTDGDVKGLDLEQIRLAINEIYARHGRAFQTEDLNEYFSSKSWYTPLYSADEFAAIEDSVMNDYEKENIKFLAAIRDSANGSASSQFEAGWIYGTYEIHDGGIDAVAEIGWYSGTGEDYISLSGATSDGSSLAEFTGTVVSSNGNSYTAVDENGDVIDFTYNGVDAIEITNGYVSDGGLYFPGFGGTYQKTADLSHNVS